MKSIYSVLIFSMLILTPIHLTALNRITLNSKESGRISIDISNSESIGCLQCIITIYGGKINSVQKGMRLNHGGWKAASNSRGDTVVNIVLINLTGDSLSTGTGECLILDCTSEGKTGTMTVIVDGIKAVSPRGTLIDMSVAKSADQFKQADFHISAQNISDPGDIANYPNPFNPVTTITFTLLQTTSLSVNIYDINGRLITVIHSGELSKGIHSVQWSGKNNTGSTVSSGIYFAGIQTQSGSVMHKMLLTK